MESSECRMEMTIGNRAAISIKTMKLILELTIKAIFVQILKTDKEKEKEKEREREKERGFWCFEMGGKFCW